MELLIFKGGVSIIVSKIKQLQVKINGDSEEDINSSIPLLIEVVSIAKRMYAYIEEKKNDTENIKTKGDSFIESHSNENDKMMLEELIDILQSLLKTNNNVLLICIIELLVSIVSNKRNLHKFRDETVLENILNVLNIVEDTEVKKRALYLLIELVQDEDIVDILKGVHFLDILAHLIEQSRLINIHNEENDESNDQTQDIKIGYWDLLKILSANKHDILPEFRRLHIIETLLDELEISKNIFHQITLLEILINLSMDDQSSLQIRECGIHIIGKKLLYTSESVDENDRSLKMLKKNWSSNADFKVYLKQFINEIQQLSLMLLRFFIFNAEK